MSSKASWQVGEVACTEVELEDTKERTKIEDYVHTTPKLIVTKPDNSVIEPTPQIDGKIVTWEYELTEAGEWVRHLVAIGTYKTKRRLGPNLIVGED